MRPTIQQQQSSGSDAHDYAFPSLLIFVPSTTSVHGRLAWLSSLVGLLQYVSRCACGDGHTEPREGGGDPSRAPREFHRSGTGGNVLSLN